MPCVNQPFTQLYRVGFDTANAVNPFDGNECDFQGMLVSDDFGSLDNRECCQLVLRGLGQMA
jgi:hypothetical protein